MIQAIAHAETFLDHSCQQCGSPAIVRIAECRCALFKYIRDLRLLLWRESAWSSGCLPLPQGLQTSCCQRAVPAGGGRAADTKLGHHVGMGEPVQEILSGLHAPLLHVVA